MQDQILVNDEISYTVGVSGTKLYLNEKLIDLDMECVKQGSYHVIFKHQSYCVDVLSSDMESKTINLKVNGQPYKVQGSDPYDALLKQMGMHLGSKSGKEVLKAPMPGMVLDVLVGEGDLLTKGDNLLILEAMKMENIIKSPGDLRVKSIEVHQGDRVEKNQILLTFQELL